MDLNCQGGWRPKQGGQAIWEAAGGVSTPGSRPRELVCPAFLSLQVLGLTFAMTLYCQVVKADTYCA